MEVLYVLGVIFLVMLAVALLGFLLVVALPAAAVGVVLSQVGIPFEIGL